jgi:hypothetical protein
MRRRDIILISVLLAAIVVGMFVYTYLERTRVAQITPASDSSITQQEDRYGLTRIDAKHFYRNGVHTIVGELPMPTPCDLLEYESRVAESSPEQVTYAFTVRNSTEGCAALVTMQRFSVSATASSAATLQATFMGKLIELNLVEAGEDESPEEFELFIKG